MEIINRSELEIKIEQFDVRTKGDPGELDGHCEESKETDFDYFSRTHKGGQMGKVLEVVNPHQK